MNRTIEFGSIPFDFFDSRPIGPNLNFQILVALRASLMKYFFSILKLYNNLFIINSLQILTINKNIPHYYLLLKITEALTKYKILGIQI